MAARAGDILVAGGLEVSKEQLLSMPERMTAYVFSRDPEAERSHAESVFGPCNEFRPGGGIYAFSSDAGEAVFRSGGYIEVSWYEGEPDLMAFLSAPEGSPAETVCDGGVCRMYINGAYVAGAELTPNGDGSFSGSWVFGSAAAGEQTDISRASMILALGRAAAELGLSSLDDIGPAYALTPLQNGDIRLTPVWRAESGDEVIYISAMSGERMLF